MARSTPAKKQVGWGTSSITHKKEQLRRVPDAIKNMDDYNKHVHNKQLRRAFNAYHNQFRNGPFIIKTEEHEKHNVPGLLNAICDRVFLHIMDCIREVHWEIKHKEDGHNQTISDSLQAVQGELNRAGIDTSKGENNITFCTHMTLPTLTNHILRVLCDNIHIDVAHRI